MVTAAAWASDRQSHNLLAKKAAIGRPSFWRFAVSFAGGVDLTFAKIAVATGCEC
jgi:hypothetical protein